MRIAVTSDIHFHPTWFQAVKRLAKKIKTERPDLLILAGDTGEPLDMFSHGLKTLKGTCERRAVLAGNHDVWHRDFSHTSQQLWEELLAEAAQEHSYHWLEGENLRMGSIGVCGSIAWYDYSGRHPGLSLEENEYERIKPMISNDANYIDWPWSDREFAFMVGEAFTERLQALEDDPQIADIVVVTHVPLYAECLKEATVPEEAIINAYYANLPLGEEVKHYHKVRVAISGHVHVEKYVELTRPDGISPIAVYTIPSDYGKPAAIVLDTETWEVQTLWP